MWVCAPHGGGGVDGPGCEDDGCAFWDGDTGDGGVAGCGAHCQGDGWVEAQDFGDEGLEVGAAVEMGGF